MLHVSYSNSGKKPANRFRPVANQNAKLIRNFPIQFLKLTYRPGGCQSMVVLDLIKLLSGLTLGGVVRLVDT